MRQFLVSAVQSALFSAVLAARINVTCWMTCAGDVATKRTGGIFVVEDVSAERPRAKAWEISATGPIYG